MKGGVAVAWDNGRACIKSKIHGKSLDKGLRSCIL